MTGNVRSAGSLASMALLCAAAALPAVADVDLAVRGNEKVKGTLRPAAERECFVLDLRRGASVTARVKRKGASAPMPVLEVTDADGTVVPGTALTSQGARFVAAVSATGLYQFRVTGDGAADGDYEFHVRVGQRTHLEETGAEVGPGGEASFAFDAPSGASATLVLSPADGSSFVPRIVAVDHPDGTSTPIAAPASARRHRAKLPLPATGEHLVRFVNDGSAPGAWTLSVRVVAPRIAKTNVDLRDEALSGSFSDSNEVFGRVLDAAGGLVDPPDEGGALDGSSILLPPNVLTSPTVIALKATDTFFVDDDNHAAGFAVEFAPAGTQFAEPVKVTVPYDPQAFDDPVSEINVYVQSADGTLEKVDRASYEIDTVLETVTFPTSHFSRFQGTSPRDRGFKGRFVQLFLGGRPLPDFGGEVVVGMDSIVGEKGPRSGNAFTRTNLRHGISFGATTLVRTGGVPVADGGIVTVQSDERITLTSQGEGPSQFVRGRDDGVFLTPPGVGGSSAALVLRVAAGAATRSNVAGEWHAVALEFRGVRDAQRAVHLVLVGRRTDLTFDLEGGVRAGATSTAIATDDHGAWRFGHDTRTPPPGTFAIVGNGAAVDLTLQFVPLESPTAVRLVPVLRGNALVGVSGGGSGPDDDADDAFVRAVLLVRAAANAGPDLLEGRALFTSFGLVPVDRPGAAQDLSFAGSDLVVQHRLPGSLTFRGTRVLQRHGSLGAPVVSFLDVDAAGKWSVTADGLYRESAPLKFGAVTPLARAYVTTQFDAPLFALGFGVVSRP